MAGSARNEQVDEGEVGLYHCFSRCVRQAFLLDKTGETEQEPGYRRDWIKDFEQCLARLFAVEVAFRGEMSNHIHVILRTRPDIAETWSDRELIRRWLNISKLVKAMDGYEYEEPKESRIDQELKKPGRVEAVRKKLSSISSFMAALCEHIARKCNREDGTEGHFWAERFKSRKLEDEPSLLLCGVYVDLNQIRAREVKTPEASLHTSLSDRIRSLLWDRDSLPPDSWMCELTVPEGPDAKVTLEERLSSVSGLRASDLGVISMDRETYIQLVDWSGRQIAEGKKGAIPSDLAPIMDRLKINTNLWLEAVERFDAMFGKVVGRVEALTRRAAELGRKYFRGVRNCEAVLG